MAEPSTPNGIQQNELKKFLLNKYRDLLVDKLTGNDLQELQDYLSREYDDRSGWSGEYRKKFELKLRTYMHEEIMRREIAGIETLLTLMTVKDLRTPGFSAVYKDEKTRGKVIVLPKIKKNDNG